jgi:hypothetical protein
MTVDKVTEDRFTAHSETYFFALTCGAEKDPRPTKRNGSQAQVPIDQQTIFRSEY